MPYTLGQLIEDYIREHAVPNGQDVYRLRLTFRTVLEFFGSEFRPKHLDRSHSRNYRAHRKAQGVTDATSGRELRMLRAALSHAFKEDRLKALPYIELPPAAPPRERFFDEHEMRKVFTEAKRRLDSASTNYQRELALRPWYFLWLASETWARAAAIEQLTVGRVDLWRRRVVDYRVPGMRLTKKRRGEITISDALWPVLYEAIHRWGPPWKDDLVIGCGFPRPWKNPPYEEGKMRPHSTTYPSVVAITKAAGIKEKFCARHIWRKTGPSHAVMNGASLEAAAAVLCDTPQTTSKHYAKFQPERARAAVNAKPVPIVLPTFEALNERERASDLPPTAQLGGATTRAQEAALPGVLQSP